MRLHPQLGLELSYANILVWPRCELIHSHTAVYCAEPGGAVYLHFYNGDSYTFNNCVFDGNTATFCACILNVV